MSRLRLHCPDGSSSSGSPILSFAYYAPLIRAERALAKSRGQALRRAARTSAVIQAGVVALIRQDGQRVPVQEAPKLFVHRFDRAGE